MKKRIASSIVLFVVLMLGCHAGSSQGVKQHITITTEMEVLKATLDGLDICSPNNDLERNIKNNDLLLIFYLLCVHYPIKY